MEIPIRECDEYPFHASYEGGAANYDSLKVSLRPISRYDNQGSDKMWNNEYMDYTIISEYAEKKDLEGLSYDDTQKDYIDTKISNIYEFMPLYDSGSYCLILIDLREQYFGRLINYVSGYAYVLAPNYMHILTT